MLDAFSSDSIPVHLLTRQALEIYLDKLSADGMLAFHISNRYLNLKPVLASVARDLNLVAMYRFDRVSDEELKTSGRMSSEWVVLARTRADLGPLANDPKWQWLEAPPRGFRTWTDDYSNLLGVFDFSNE